MSERIERKIWKFHYENSFSVKWYRIHIMFIDVVGRNGLNREEALQD